MDLESAARGDCDVLVNTRVCFEDELQRRGVAFSIDEESGRHVLEVAGARLLISLDNLEREMTDGDTGRVTRFVDAIVASVHLPEQPLCADQLYWCLDANDSVERADYRAALSDRVDRVLVHLSSDGRHITWLTPEMLNSLQLSEVQAAEMGFVNLSRALSQATIESRNVDGVPLCFINTPLPFKASLILASNLREIAGDLMGWPMLAVLPDRDFLYLWPARHKDFLQRVGAVVVREYSSAPYPISTEVYEISDNGIEAIGAFPVAAGKCATGRPDNPCA